MSYDLEVFAARRPQVPDGVPELCEVDGPLETQDEDAPARVVAALLAVRWTVQISTAPKQAPAARRLAKAIADSGRGVVYDPQEDAIIWPRNPAKLRKVETSRDKADDDWDSEIELRWLVPRRLTSADAHRLLSVLRDVMPEAVPVRFGDYEPMQGRLDRDGDSAFAAYWDGDMSMFWSGHAPVRNGWASLNRGWGSALTPQERAASTPVIAGRPGLRPDAVSLHFSPAVIRDPDWLDAIAALLGPVAEMLDAFFAVGSQHKHKVYPARPYWLGLPTEPMWLGWTGSAYGGPALTRTSAVPDKPRRIAWPAELVRNGETAAAVIPDFGTA